MPIGVWLIHLAYMTLLVSIAIYICINFQLHIGGGTADLSLCSLPFIKDTLLAQALMLSPAGINDVFRHLGICMYILLDSSDGVTIL